MTRVGATVVRGCLDAKSCGRTIDVEVVASGGGLACAIPSPRTLIGRCKQTDGNSWQALNLKFCSTGVRRTNILQFVLNMQKESDRPKICPAVFVVKALFVIVHLSIWLLEDLLILLICNHYLFSTESSFRSSVFVYMPSSLVS